MRLAAISGVKGVYSDADIAKVVTLAKKARLTWKGGSAAAAPAKKRAPAKKAVTKKAAPVKKAAAKKAPAKKAVVRKAPARRTAARAAA
jgi:hypothetical protein